MCLKVSNFISLTHDKNYLLGHAWNPGTEAEGPTVEASLGYTARPCLNQTKILTYQHI
jgi:hypothetical protein